MKKFIATIIRAIMPKAVRQHKREEKAKRIHNAVIMQTLLDNEYMIKEAVNKRFDTVYTTAKALKTARVYGMNDYNSALALRNADFRWCVVRMNENVDGTGSPAITLHSLYLYNNIYNKLDAAQNAKTYALNSILNFISLL